MIIRQPQATEGSCKRCHRWTDLGDGYCVRCWDIKANAMVIEGDEFIPADRQVISPADVAAIKDYRAKGISQIQTARALNISTQTIRKYIGRWRKGE